MLTTIAISLRSFVLPFASFLKESPEVANVRFMGHGGAAPRGSIFAGKQMEPGSCVEGIRAARGRNTGGKQWNSARRFCNGRLAG